MNFPRERCSCRRLVCERQRQLKYCSTFFVAVYSTQTCHRHPAKKSAPPPALNTASPDGQEIVVAENNTVALTSPLGLRSPNSHPLFLPRPTLPCCWCCWCCCCVFDIFASGMISSEQISLSERVKARGGNFLEAPVSGSKGQAAGVGNVLRLARQHP